MGRWLLSCLVLCSGAVALVGWMTGAWSSDPTKFTSPETSESATLTQQQIDLKVRVTEQTPQTGRGRSITIPEGRLLVVEKQEVAAEAEGTILFIGTELKPDEKVSADKVILQQMAFLAIQADPSGPDTLFAEIGKNRVPYRRWEPGLPLIPTQTMLLNEQRKYRKLAIGDRVQKGDLVALVNPEMAIHDIAIASTALDKDEADRLASIKTYEEYRARWEKNKRLQLQSPGSVAQEDVDSLRLGMEKTQLETRMKIAAVTKSERELSAADSRLRMHQIRARTNGIVKMIYKNSGDAIRKLDPVVQIINTERMRVESLIGIEQTPFLRRNMKVNVEASRPDTPTLILSGHHLDVTSVAVSNTSPAVIVSGSEDRTVRGWEATAGGRMLWEIGPFTTAIRSVACSPRTSQHALALIGIADGSCWLFDLQHPDKLPVELQERHKGSVNAVAFSPDGKLCATAGDDRSIILWDVATRKKEQAYLGAHGAAITSLDFVTSPADQEGSGLLVSTARDNTHSVWAVNGSNPLKRIQEFVHRSGDVTFSNSDGQRVLFDLGKELRVQSISDKSIQGALQATSGASTFTKFAMFAPDGKTILTSSTENKLQLWRTPEHDSRGAEVRQYLWHTNSVCGAFAPDNSFAVTGTKDGKLLVWAMPAREEIEKRISATLVLVEQTLDSSTMQVRIWAELDEVPNWLVPGSSATIVVPVEQGNALRAGR